MRAAFVGFEDDTPWLLPVIAHETTDYGWRGLTAEGEVFEVKGIGDGPVSVPDSILQNYNGTVIGRRKIENQPIDIGAYLTLFNHAVALYKANRVKDALNVSEATLQIASTQRARFNHAMILLASGRWREGLSRYWECEQHLPFKRPQVVDALQRGLKPWMGQSLHDKRIVLLHAHGFGDSIQCLRYVPRFRDKIVIVPDELHCLARQVGPALTDIADVDDADYFCPLLHLLHFLRVAPEHVSGKPYLASGSCNITSRKRKIGIAWSIGKPSDGDYPREIPLDLLVQHFRDDQLFSVQIQNVDEAKRLGVQTFAMGDFSDCANLMTAMDAIVSVDTAALHLAGAIGHPKVFGLLSHWASWRWLAPWYGNVKLCRQTLAGDWQSALAQVR